MGVNECNFYSVGNSNEDLEEKTACKAALSNLPTEESLLSKIHYIRCTDYLQLLAAVRRLNEFCKYHPNASFAIVISVNVLSIRIVHDGSLLSTFRRDWSLWIVLLFPSDTNSKIFPYETVS